MSEYSAPNEKKTTRRRKVQAVMAGGLVLGVGAVVTLAAWNDSEFAEGIFGAGTFDLVGSTDGVTFDNHPDSAGAAELTLDTEEASNLTPGDSVYLPFAVQLSEGTSHAGIIEAGEGLEVAANGDGANNEFMSFNVYSVESVDACSAEGIPADPVAAGEDLTAVTTPLSNPIQLQAEAGNIQAFCFEVTAGDAPGFGQGETASVTWEILATSNDS